MLPVQFNTEIINCIQQLINFIGLVKNSQIKVIN